MATTMKSNKLAEVLNYILEVIIYIYRMIMSHTDTKLLIN